MAKRAHDTEAQAAKEIYEIGKSHAATEIEALKAQLAAQTWVAEMSGKIKATLFTKAQAEFFNLVMLKQVKDSKEYRERFGLTWEQFCENVGVNRRWVDEQLADLKPFKADFLARFAGFLGTDFNKIKYLASEKLEENLQFSDNAIIYNGETIPLTPEHRDDIQELLEQLEVQARERESDIKAKDKWINKKEQEIQKSHRTIDDLKKRLDGIVDLDDLTEEEHEAIDVLRSAQLQIEQALQSVKQKISYESAPEVALRQLYFLHIYLAKRCSDERLALHEVYKDAEQVPWEIHESELPSADVLVDNLPLTAGKGIGAKMKAKQQGRKK